jgi:hypothetical protein
VYYFHGKMPGCCLQNLTAATALHVTAGYLKLSLQQEPTPCFAFLVFLRYKWRKTKAR